MVFLKRLVMAAVALYLLAAGAMFVFQRSFLFFPSQENPTPQAQGLADVSVQSVTTADGEVLVLWYAAATEGAPTVLFLHGNAGEIGNRANRFATYQRAGLGVAFLSWRGYGGSSGAPSEAGFRIDAWAAYDWLMGQGVRSEDLVVIGESLGTGMAVQLAAARPVGAVILGAPYTSVADLGAARYPWLPVQLLSRDPFRSINHIGDVTAPTLILHGTEDAVVPYASGQALFAASTEPTEFEAIPGAGHEVLFHPDSWAREIDFIERNFAW